MRGDSMSVGDEATLEIIRRVESAPLSELVAVDIDDVQVHMDRMLEPDVDAAGFYRRWETQQWAVSELDFSRDVDDWNLLPEGVRQVIRSTMTAFFLGEQAVTDTLSPILHAAEAEDERIFLATQLADEARHTVFFQRFFAEVLGVRGGLAEALGSLRPRAREGFRRIFDEALVGATERVRIDPDDQVAWVEAVVTYHLIVEGYLALTGQRTLLRILRNVNLLPGFVTGFTAVARDESRHIGFGVLCLRRRVARDPEVARIVARRVLDLLEPAVMTVVAPDQRLPYEDPSGLPPGLRLNPLDVRAFAIESLAKRLRSAGLSAVVVEGISARASSLYEELWDRYETEHGLRHPVRWWQEHAGLS